MGSIGGTNAVIEEPIPVRPVPRFLSQFLFCSWESTGEGKGNVVVREKSAEEQQGEGLDLPDVVKCFGYRPRNAREKCRNSGWGKFVVLGQLSERRAVPDEIKERQQQPPVRKNLPSMALLSQEWFDPAKNVVELLAAKTVDAPKGLVRQLQSLEPTSVCGRASARWGNETEKSNTRAESIPSW